jgi:hypothetical protein
MGDAGLGMVRLAGFAGFQRFGHRLAFMIDVCLHPL